MGHLLPLLLIGLIAVTASDRGLGALRAALRGLVGLAHGLAAYLRAVASWYVRVVLGPAGER